MSELALSPDFAMPSLQGTRADAFMFKSLAFVVGPLHVLFSVWVTCHALLNKRDVRAAIGWIGTVWLAPFVGALLYVGFGISRVRRRARRLMGADRGVAARVTRDVSSDDPIERLKLAVGKITAAEIHTGKVMAILHSGVEGYPCMLAAIEAAKISVDLSSYIFRTDRAGSLFVEALIRAHRRGVRVRVLIDGIGGGFILSPAYHRLRAEGVPAARFLHSIWPWQMPLLDLRLHKKVLVIDGATAFVGGLNIGAENTRDAEGPPRVTDRHFQLEGSVVRQIGADFDDDWSFTTRQSRRADPVLASPVTAGGAARMIVAGPDQATDQLVLVLLSAINLAQRSIKIATPYFLPDEPLVTALQLAVLRGVKVDIVLPGVNNHRLVAWAMAPHIAPLLETGCRVWRSPPPFDHTKLMTIDGKWSLIGSANWDMRSLRLNFEITVELYDEDFAVKVARIIDEKCAEPLTSEELRARPFIVKLRDAAARLATPYI
jgi:cardiolipin synthase A/B